MADRDGGECSDVCGKVKGSAADGGFCRAEFVDEAHLGEALLPIGDVRWHHRLATSHQGTCRAGAVLGGDDLVEQFQVGRRHLDQRIGALRTGTAAQALHFIAGGQQLQRLARYQCTENRGDAGIEAD